MTETTELDVMGLDEIEIENTAVEEIDSENVNLIFVGIDQSGSMSSYVNDMVQSLTEFKVAIKDSKEADEILVARANFEDTIDVGGYKKIDDFDINYFSRGNTALYDVICEGETKLSEYITFLKNQGMRVKAVFALFSDGEDTCSRQNAHAAKTAVKRLNDAEITTAFISFGGGATNIANALGFVNILTVGSSATELRKAFNCLSKSVIESSKSVVGSTDDFFVM